MFRSAFFAASFQLLRQPWARTTSIKYSTAGHAIFRIDTTRTAVIQLRSYHARMSTQSHACCTVPPVVADGYKEKGEWTKVDGMKTYVTGPKDAKQALLVVVSTRPLPFKLGDSREFVC